MRSRRSLGERPHRDQVLIFDGPHVSGPESHQGLGLAGGGHKLDFEAIRLVDLDHCSEIASPQPVLRKVAVEDHSVEKIHFHGLR
jgi:hypothetical protein